jgi:hypothetical protein
MAYTVDTKTDLLTQHEGQNTGSDPLRSNEYQAKVRIVNFDFTALTTYTSGATIGLCPIPKGARVIGVSMYWNCTDAATVFEIKAYGVSSGTTAGAGSALTVDSVAGEINQWLANQQAANVIAEDSVAVLTVGVAGDIVNGDSLQGFVLYAID